MCAVVDKGMCVCAAEGSPVGGAKHVQALERCVSGHTCAGCEWAYMRQVGPSYTCGHTCAR